MYAKLVDLLFVTCKIGLLAFGGGNSAISLLEAEAVPRWLSKQQFGELVGVNFALPGVSVLKLAAMVGMQVAGLPGLLVAVVGLAAPGLALTVGAFGLITRFRDNPFVGKALLAMQFGAAAILLSSTLNIWTTAAGSRWNSLAVLLTGGLFLAVHFGKLPPAWAIAAAVVLGGWLL